MIDPNFWYSKIERMKGAPDVVAINVCVIK
jgi:hypothetical protein